MCRIGNCGAASEFYEARQDFREIRQETREAGQHFAEAQEQFAEASQDFARGNILGGIAHTIAGRRELAEGRQDQHLAQGYMDQALGFGGFGCFGGLGALGGFYGGLGPNIDPGFIFGGFGGPSFDPGFSPGAAKGTDGQAGATVDPNFAGLEEEEEEEEERIFTLQDV